MDFGLWNLWGGCGSLVDGLCVFDLACGFVWVREGTDESGARDARVGDGPGVVGGVVSHKSGLWFPRVFLRSYRCVCLFFVVVEDGKIIVFVVVLKVETPLIVHRAQTSIGQQCAACKVLDWFDLGAVENNLTFHR